MTTADCGRQVIIGPVVDAYTASDLTAADGIHYCAGDHPYILPRDVYAPELRTLRDVSRWFDRMVTAGIDHHPDDSAYIGRDHPYRTGRPTRYAPGDPHADARGIVGHAWFRTAPLLHLARHDRAMDAAHRIAASRGADPSSMLMRAEDRAARREAREPRY